MLKIPSLLALLLAMLIPVSSVLAHEGGEPVFGVLGTIRGAENERFDDFLLTNDGAAYGIVGVDPAVEQEIVRLRENEPGAVVKVWGTLYKNVNDIERRQIVVTDILLADDRGQGGTTPAILVEADLLNVRSGPGTEYARVGQILAGERYDIVGRSQDNAWWLICCVSESEVWVFASLVTAEGDTAAVPTVAVSPPVTAPAPDEFEGWKASYFGNARLAGAAVAVQDVPLVAFDWGAGSPLEGVPADEFSVRYERTLDLVADAYRLTLRADDGVRLWLDRQLLIDEWHGDTGETFTVDRFLAGEQALRIDYFEAVGDAGIHFTIEPLPTATGEWRASYFDNIGLEGAPVWVQNESQGSATLVHNWGAGSPLAGAVPVDRWSGRWRGEFFFEAGDYLFRAKVDDGVRVWLDGHLLLDGWSDGGKTVENTFNRIGRGQHGLMVEYYERAGSALILLDWEKRARQGGYFP